MNKVSNAINFYAKQSPATRNGITIASGVIALIAAVALGIACAHPSTLENLLDLSNRTIVITSGAVAGTSLLVFLSTLGIQLKFRKEIFIMDFLSKNDHTFSLNSNTGDLDTRIDSSNQEFKRNTTPYNTHGLLSTPTTEEAKNASLKDRFAAAHTELSEEQRDLILSYMNVEAAGDSPLPKPFAMREEGDQSPHKFFLDKDSLQTNRTVSLITIRENVRFLSDRDDLRLTATYVIERVFNVEKKTSTHTAKFINVRVDL